MFLKALEIAQARIEDVTFLCSTRAKKSYFTRGGKLSFVHLLGFMLNFNKKSIQLELDDFLNLIKGTQAVTVTKQAFSAARQKILPKAFIILNNDVVKLVYSEDDFNRYKGYRLLAVDGSRLSLNNTDTMRAAFGYVKNQTTNVALAQASALYDIENDIIVTASINRYETGERDMALKHIDILVKEFGLKNDLILFDRGYPSKKLLARLSDENISYAMRIQVKFTKEINDVKENDQVVEVTYEDKKYKVRVVKVILENGTTETLISNIFDRNFSTNDFKELYFKRWGIENKFDELKNRLQLENFTGDTEIAVQQDFYASIYLSNMVALAKASAEEELNEKNQGKNLKYEYQVNTNILIGKLKDKLILMLLEDNTGKRSKILDGIMQEIVRNTVPIRPGRQNERPKNFKTHKYPPNQKRSL